MVKKRSLCIAFASIFTVTSMCLLMVMRDAKAQSMESLLKRIEALEAKPTGNVTAPKIRGLKIGFDIRHRFEQQVQWANSSGLATPTVGADGIITYGNAGSTNAGVMSRTGAGRTRDEDFVLQRVRIHFDADVNKNVRGFVKLQDSRTFGESEIATNEERTDLLEAYVDLRNLGDLSPMLENIEARVGRWQWAYGDHRLIGTLNWANQARSYDGARLRWANGKNTWIDVFAAMISEEDTGGVSGSDSLGDNDEVLYGIYSQFKFSGGLKGVLVEPYFIGRSRSSDPHGETGQTGEDRYTFGLRLDGREMGSLPGVDFTLEPAWQLGEVEGLRAANLGANSVADINPDAGGLATGQTNQISAWAIYAGAGYTFKNMAWTPRIGYAYVFASGDDNPVTGGTTTFDHLYPTGHAQLGYMDQAGWQNIKDHQIHFNVKPTKKLVIDTKVHFFSLDEEADNWYSVGGGTGWGGSLGVIRAGADQFTDALGNTRSLDEDLGQEIDITLKYQLFNNFGVVAGYGHYFADDFIEDTVGGGGTGDRGMDWVWLQTTMKF